MGSDGPNTGKAVMRIWHVYTSDGRIYGVAASNGTEAKLFAQDRLTQDESKAHPVKAVSVGRATPGSGWSYGAVLAY
jgi:hypothetical protein